MDEKEDVQKKILFIILIVIIFVSILGTWTILGAIDNVKANAVRDAQTKAQAMQNPTAAAAIGLEILPRKEGGT